MCQCFSMHRRTENQGRCCNEEDRSRLKHNAVDQKTASRQRSTMCWAQPQQRKSPMRLIRARMEKMTCIWNIETRSFAETCSTGRKSPATDGTKTPVNLLAAGRGIEPTLQDTYWVRSWRKKVQVGILFTSNEVCIMVLWKLELIPGIKFILMTYLYDKMIRMNEIIEGSDREVVVDQISTFKTVSVQHIWWLR